MIRMSFFEAAINIRSAGVEVATFFLSEFDSSTFKSKKKIAFLNY